MGTPRSATRPRRRLPALVAALMALSLVLGGLTGLAPRAAAQQDTPTARAVDQITQRDFDRLTRAAQKNEVLFGPEQGSLPLDKTKVAFVDAGVTTENFLVHAEFTNPYAAATGQWDYGFQFRSQSQSEFLRLILLSDGSWGLTEGLQNVPDSGAVDGGVNDGEGDTNTLDLYVEGDIGHFAVNDVYVASVDLPVSGEGDILLGSGYLNDSFQANAETGYAQFIVWSLDAGALGPDATATPDDSGGLSSRDLTATARAEDRTATAEADTTDLSSRDQTATARADASGLSDADLTATAEADRGNTGDEPTYTSPTFGYSLSYGDPWTKSDETSDRNGDLLALDTPNSSLQIVGNASSDTPTECLDGLISSLQGDATISGVEVATDDQGRDLRDDSPELSWAVVFLTTQSNSGKDIDLTGYYECRVIEEGQSLLTIIHLALSDDYNDEIANRTAVTDTIEINSGGSTTAPTRRRTPTPSAGDQPTKEATQRPNRTPTPGGGTPSADDGIPFLLDAVGNSNVTAFGLITPSGRNTATVQVLALGASGVVTIHTGTCARPDATPAFELGELDASGSLETKVDASAADLTSGDYVMILSDDGTPDTATACGDLSALAS